MKDHLKKSSETSKPVRLFWKFFLYAWSAVFLLILLIYVGLFGKLPSIEELENPSMMSSSEIYADDGTMMGKFYLKDRPLFLQKMSDSMSILESTSKVCCVQLSFLAVRVAQVQLPSKLPKPCWANRAVKVLPGS